MILPKQNVSTHKAELMELWKYMTYHITEKIRPTDCTEKISLTFFLRGLSEFKFFDTDGLNFKQTPEPVAWPALTHSVTLAEYGAFAPPVIRIFKKK